MLRVVACAFLRHQRAQLPIRLALLALVLIVAIPPARTTAAPTRNWVRVATDSDGISTFVDEDSIQRGDYGFLYYIDDEDDGQAQDMAVDCQKRVMYVVKVVLDGNGPDWRDSAQVVEPGSVGEAELNYVCAIAG